jgi:hypothetical protein
VASSFGGRSWSFGRGFVRGCNAIEHDPVAPSAPGICIGESAARPTLYGGRLARSSLPAGSDGLARRWRCSPECRRAAVFAARVSNGRVQRCGGPVGKVEVKKLASSPPPLDVVADPPGSLRALAPGKSAGFELFWSNWCGPGATPTGASGALPDTLMLQLPSHTTIAVPVAHAPRCDAPQYPSVVSIGPFAPAVRHLPESSRLPLRARIVGRRAVKVKPGVSAFLVHRGQLLTYTVALTNTGNTAFHFAHSSCPTYIEEIATTHAQVYVLNCRPVPSIAPHETVLFEMRIVIADDTRAGINSLTWELAPKTYEAPFAPATLRILP